MYLHVNFSHGKTVEEDTLVWIGDTKGKFTTARAWNSIRQVRPKVSWHKQLWNNACNARTASTAWKLLHSSAATDDKLQQRGCALHHTVSRINVEQQEQGGQYCITLYR